jgi:hypothetical protein
MRISRGLQYTSLPSAGGRRTRVNTSGWKRLAAVGTRSAATSARPSMPDAPDTSTRYGRAAAMAPAQGDGGGGG